MMRSLFAGVAGLKTHQTRMDVIGNNIANVNTTAYKSQSMTFSDLMYQTTQAASGANAVTGVGGTNARQIGLGSKTSAIKTAISTQGAAQSTNDPFDIMITGSSFFVVSNGVENFFTRDGSFYVDGAGNLAMTSTGYNVMGWQVDPTNENNIKKDTVSPLRVMTTENMTYPPEASTKATVSGVIDKFDTDIKSREGRIMNLEFYDNQGYKYTARMSIHAVDGDTGQFAVCLDDILDSDGETIIGKNGVAPADITLKVGGNDPERPNGVTGKLGASTLNYANGKGTFVNVGQAAPTGTTAAVGNTSLTLSFDATKLPNFQNVEIDFSGTFNYNKNGTSTIEAVSGDKTGLGSGRKIGEMSGITVQKDGMIYASYDNGQRRLLGQIAVANFANPSGLAKAGDNLYSSTMNSGEFDGIGDDITEDGGYMNSGVLEMSNVDLAAEFTEMITTQRGFQANSRIITVSDTLLEELTNLKR